MKTSMLIFRTANLESCISKLFLPLCTLFLLSLITNDAFDGFYSNYENFAGVRKIVESKEFSFVFYNLPKMNTLNGHSLYCLYTN